MVCGMWSLCLCCQVPGSQGSTPAKGSSGDGGSESLNWSRSPVTAPTVRFNAPPLRSSAAGRDGGGAGWARPAGCPLPLSPRPPLVSLSRMFRCWLRRFPWARRWELCGEVGGQGQAPGLCLRPGLGVRCASCTSSALRPGR